MTHSLRGQIWFDRITQQMQVNTGPVASIQTADGELAGRSCRVILVRPDPENRFPRAQNGEAGLLEGWALGKVVNDTLHADASNPVKTTLLCIVDIPSQAYGRREEALGIHQSLASAAAAYARARQHGHPVLALLVGKAMSGAFLAHGYQANTIIALNDSAVQVHAMGKAAAARITQRSEAALDALAADIPPMAYDLKSYASLGLLSQLISVSDADAPSTDDVTQVTAALIEAQNQAAQTQNLAHRFLGEHRQASREVRSRLRQQWQAHP